MASRTYVGADCPEVVEGTFPIRCSAMAVGLLASGKKVLYKCQHCLGRLRSKAYTSGTPSVPVVKATLGPVTEVNIRVIVVAVKAEVDAETGGSAVGWLLYMV